jgi:phage gpG-like protein
MVSSVTVDFAPIQGAIRRLSRYIYDDARLMDNIGRVLRDYVRQTIASSGRKRPYAPLSWWTTQRTGRRKPLSTIPRRISYSADKTTATVFYRGDQTNWSINAHHTGYKIPARKNVLMAVPLARGGAIFFHNARATRVPAREIWPTQKEVATVVSHMVNNWIKEGVRKTWRP